jgi:hypothetical protein
MPEIKPFFATNQFRTDDSGYSAFETLGRRVGAQYEQAGNDLRDIGRSKAQVINMLGRWPMNILDLEKRETARLTAGSQSSGSKSGSGVSVAGGGRRVADPWARRFPDLSALNEMSNGAASFGRMVGGYPGMGGTMSPEYRRNIEDQQKRETDRYNQLQDAASQKRYDLYEKGLSDYNKSLQSETQKWYDTQGQTESQWQAGAVEAKIEDVNPSPVPTQTVEPVDSSNSYAAQGGTGDSFDLFSPSTWW